MDSRINGFGNAGMPEKDGKQFTGHVKEQGVDAKDMKELAPFLFSFNINEIHQQSL
jgi:hypothetical protein